MSNAQYLPDHSPGSNQSEDLLGITQEVDRLARLITSRTLAPPLSLGIFGGPGSGKSFFADVLRRRIRELSDNAELRNDKENVVGAVVQIELNAWQSVGVSPWILLAEQIYKAMEEPLPDGDPESERILHTIPTARQMDRQLETELDGARAALNEAAEEDERLLRAYREASQDRVQLEKSSIWMKVGKQFLEKLDPATIDEIDRDGERLGLTRLSRNPESLHRLLEETKTVGGTADILTNIRVARRYFRSALLIVLAIVLAALGLFFGYYIFEKVRGFQAEISTFFAVLAGVSATVGAIGVLFTGFTQNQASQALKRLRRHEAELGDIIGEVETKHKVQLSLATDELEQRRTAMAASEGSLITARRSVAVADSRLTEFSRRPVGPRMIDAYRRYDPALQTLPAKSLSSAATSLQLVIRADMEALSARCARVADQTPEGGSRPPKRVIVYIDDLELCDPLTATAYLQAIQQLLAFPLFAVILLTDPHRLVRALRVTDIADYASPNDGVISSEQTDYLARLFPLHFWIKPTNMQQLSEMANHWSLARNADPQAAAFLQKVATILESPRQVEQLVNLYGLAQLLRDQESPVELAPDSSKEVAVALNRKARASSALQTHLAVLVLSPTQGRQYLEIVDGIDPGSTIDIVLQDMHSGQIDMPAITKLFETYDRETDSPTPVADLKDWIPVVQRLVI